MPAEEARHLHAQNNCETLDQLAHVLPAPLQQGPVTEWEGIPEVSLKQVFVRVFTSDSSSITPSWLVQPALCTNQNLIKTSGCTSQDGVDWRERVKIFMHVKQQRHRLKLHFCYTFLFCAPVIYLY
jgi:hypothetical protein